MYDRAFIQVGLGVWVQTSSPLDDLRAAIEQFERAARLPQKPDIITEQQARVLRALAKRHEKPEPTGNRKQRRGELARRRSRLARFARKP